MQSLRSHPFHEAAGSAPVIAWPFRAAAAGAVYAAGALTAGTVLGFLRELYLAPRITSELAIVVETPLMIWICFALAPLAVRMLGVGSDGRARTLMAIAGVAVLLSVENMASLAWRDRTLLEQWGLYGWLALAASLAGVAAFVLAPFLAKARRG